MSSRIGYACINTSLGQNGKFKTITVTHASKLLNKDLITKIKELSLSNLTNILGILKWNIQRNIRMYRITSDVIPLATHPLSDNWHWSTDEDILDICNKINYLVINYGLRLSFHPDHFTVINSLNSDVIQSSIQSLNYHNTLSDMMGSNTLVMHIGGVYGNKSSALERFTASFKSLKQGVQDKIVLENDDKSYTVEDTLSLCKQLSIPMCLDFHHNRCNISPEELEYYIKDIIYTWKGKTPKLHLSTGRNFITDRSHADYILQEDFNSIRDIYPEADVMLECKSKELAILKLDLRYQR